MLELAGYQTVKWMGSNEEIELYQLLRLADNRSVIAKTTRDKYPSPRAISAFRFEYDILVRLGGRGAVEPYGLEFAADRPVLLMRDFDGRTLEQIMRERTTPIEVPALLGIAASIADCLVHIHREQITLEEITPLYLMVNPDTFEVKWIDLRMCSTVSGKSPLSLQAGRPETVLPYISPEQTGRAGRPPDYRSDFYSLGVTLYEWLTGNLPFKSQDAQDIVYHHLASMPKPVSARALFVPRMVSDIVGKCLEKSADARYASAFGLKSDLEFCLEQYRESGTVKPFVLAGNDIPDRWVFPANLYGRQSEQQILLRALQRSTEGAVKVVWVSGGEGIGKTSIVQDMLRTAVSPAGFSASGKFDPGRVAIPYDVWIQAIGELVGQLLTENEAMAEVWKLRILNAAGGYGRLLTDLVPRLALLIGEQPPVQPLPPVEAQNRFHILLTRFIQLFAASEHPLVLFFDDLQWADEASLQFLAHLLTDRDSKGLMVVGAFRDAEAMPPHPLRRLEKQLGERNVSVRELHLRALDIADLIRILQDAMRSESAGVDELAAVLLHKTGGNPFFLKQFLQELIDRGLVTFDDRGRRWEWHLQLIADMSIPDNAAAFLSVRMKHLPDRAVHALGRAAGFGNHFDLDTLAAVTGFPEPELLDAIGIAVHERLLQPVGGGNKEYKFQHDRIQQSAYALISEAERPELHLRIGRVLAHRMESDKDTNIFEAVNQMNKALEIIRHPEHRLELAEWNLQAGLKAKQSTAYETALGYFSHATALLEKDCWTSGYALAFQCYKERAESEFLCAHFDTANELFNLLQHKAVTNLDKALVCRMKLQLESNKDNDREVIALGKMALELLGVRHNFEPSTVELTRQWLRLKWKLRKHPIDSLDSLPPLTDEARQVAMTVLAYIGASSYVLNKKSWVAVSFAMLEMTLDHGIAPESSIGFAALSLFVYFRFRDYKEAYEWGMLASKVSKPYPALYVRVLSSFTLCFDSWRQYQPDLLRTLTDYVGKEGLESGDVWHGNLSVLINVGLLFQFGHPLGDIYKRLIAHSSEFLHNNNSLHLQEASLFAEMLSQLTGYCAPDDPFVKKGLKDERLTEWIQAESFHEEHIIGLQELYCISRYVLGYLFGRYREAQQYLTRAAFINDTRSFDVTEHSGQYMFESLVWAELYAEEGERERGVMLEKMRDRMRKLKDYAKRCPQNYRHKYLLVKAELARLKHKHRETEALYEQAIEDARVHGHIHNVGIISERYAKYFLSQGKRLLAKVYMTESYEAYRQWGAAVKAAQLKTAFGHLLHVGSEPGQDPIDALSVAMSAQVLSGEMEMPRLLNTLMRIMLRNAGAGSGALIFEHGGNWFVEAHGTEEELVIRSVPLEDAKDIVPSAIIGYVARTGDVVVLHDAAEDGMFARNSYVRENRLKSVLCLPIMHQDKLICLLFMENKLVSGLFTPQRLEMLKLLGSQCAISIDNARLYSGMQALKNGLEQQVEERTRSLERAMRETAAALAEMSVYEERNRIAKEIHDVVGHTLTSTILQIEAGKLLMFKDRENAANKLEEAQQLVRHGLNEIRRSVHMLKEGQSFRLEHALSELIQDTQRNTGVQVHARIPELPELSTMQKKTIYHALQESLTNGIRHGGSTEFRFNLDHDGSSVQFRLEDNGKGTDAIMMGFGLKSMKERVDQLGGNLHIGSNPSGGFQLQIGIPHQAALGEGALNG